MKTKTVIASCIAAVIVASTLVFAQAPKPASQPIADPRIDKLLQQNELILKNQQEILKQLEDVKTVVGGLKRRAT